MPRNNKEVFVSVIVPTFNRGEILLETIKKLFKQTYDNFELIVVDQTNDKKYDISKELNKIVDDRLKIFYVRPNSLTAARNFGMEKAKGEIIMYIDDDVIVENNLIKEHVKSYKKGIVAVAGKITQKGHPHYNYVTYFDKYGFQNGLFNAPKPVFCQTFPGGNMSVRRSVALKTGGFDTSFTGSSVREESEFAHRLSQSGKIYYQPSANLVHLAIPFGGCRIYSHQYDNLDFYYNELRFVYKTVDKKFIPMAILKRIKKYCFQSKRPNKIIKRLALFVAALFISIKRLLVPVKIELVEVEN